MNPDGLANHGAALPVISNALQHRQGAIGKWRGWAQGVLPQSQDLNSGSDRKDQEDGENSRGVYEAGPLCPGG